MVFNDEKTENSLEIQFYAIRNVKKMKRLSQCGIFMKILPIEKRLTSPKNRMPAGGKSPRKPLHGQGGNDTIKLIQESFFPINGLENTGGKHENN